MANFCHKIPSEGLGSPPRLGLILSCPYVRGPEGLWMSLACWPAVDDETQPRLLGYSLRTVIGS